MIDTKADYVLFLDDPSNVGLGHTVCTVKGDQVAQALVGHDRFYTFLGPESGKRIIVNLDRVIRIVPK